MIRKGNSTATTGSTGNNSSSTTGSTVNNSTTNSGPINSGQGQFNSNAFISSVSAVVVAVLVASLY